MKNVNTLSFYIKTRTKDTVIFLKVIFITFSCLFVGRLYLRKKAIPSDGIGFMFTAADGEKFVKEKYGILPLSDISESLRKNISLGVDRVLEKGADERLWPENLSYEVLIKSYDLMYRFLEICHRHPELYADDVFDGVRRSSLGPETRMSNGLFLKQIEQFLVYMTAKVQFNKYLPEGMDARKLTMVAPYLAYSWQLPFLQAYENMREEIILEVGPDLLEIRTKRGLNALMRLKYEEIVKARSLLHEKFGDVLRMNPVGIRNLLECSPEKYKELSDILHDKIYAFLCRDSELFDDVLKTPREILELFGEDLLNVSSRTFRRLLRLPKDRAVLFMTKLVDLYPQVTKKFASSEFVNFTFRRAIERLLDVEGDSAYFQEVVRLKTKAMKEVIPSEKNP